MLNRRGFLTSLAAALVAPVDPDRLLWVPGARLYSIPKPQPHDPCMCSICQEILRRVSRHLYPAYAYLDWRALQLYDAQFRLVTLQNPELLRPVTA